MFSTDNQLCGMIGFTHSVASRIHRRRTRSSTTALTCGVSRRASEDTHRNTGIVDRAIRIMRNVTTRLSQTTRNVATIGRRSRVVHDVIRAVQNVTRRAGLLTLGTTVRTTETNRRNQNFTIITSRMQGLTTHATRTAIRVISIIGHGRRLTRSTIRDVRTDHRGISRNISLIDRTNFIVRRVRDKTQRMISTIHRFTRTGRRL